MNRGFRQEKRIPFAFNHGFINLQCPHLCYITLADSADSLYYCRHRRTCQLASLVSGEFCLLISCCGEFNPQYYQARARRLRRYGRIPMRKATKIVWIIQEN